MENEKHRPPQKTAADAGHIVVKAAISSVPLVGGAGAEFFDYLVASPLEKRRETWADQVGETLRKLTDQVDGLEERLRGSTTFADVALHAAQAAMRTSSEAKRTALKNAVVNAALDFNPDLEQQHLFIKFVDDLSPLQMVLLNFFNDPLDWYREA